MNKQPEIDLHGYARSCLGQYFHDRTLTEEQLAESIIPALDMLAELEKACGGGFKVVGIEETVEFPGVLSSKGTVDVILQSPSHVVFADYKFGQGVPVSCVYDTGDGELLNAQLAFYIASALYSRPSLAEGRIIIGAILQPRIEGGLSYTEVSREEIYQFIEDVHAAITIAIGRDPPLSRGAHCRWCPAKISCPKWTGPAVDLSKLGILPRPATISKEPTPYGQYLAKAKALIDGLLLMKQDIDAQIVSYIEDGGTVPGWKLKAKATNRKWIDEAVVVPALEKLGLAEHEIWQKKLQTFTIADAAAKRLGVKIPEHLRVAPPTHETTLAAADDPAPAVDRKLQVVEFQKALRALTAKIAPRNAQHGERP